MRSGAVNGFLHLGLVVTAHFLGHGVSLSRLFPVMCDWVFLCAYMESDDNNFFSPYLKGVEPRRPVVCDPRQVQRPRSAHG